MRLHLIVFAFSTVFVFAGQGAAEIIVHQSLADGSAEFFPGQSLTTPSGGPWTDLKFNWYGDTDGTSAFSPTAFGTLYLLSLEYLGTPAGLSSSVSGFMAETQSISGGQYVFDPAVTVQPGSQYFFYANASGVNVGANNPYAGGNVYVAGGPGGSTFAPTAGDAAFRLDGNAVPEPSTMTMALSGILLASICWWRRRTPVGKGREPLLKPAPMPT